MAIGESEMKKRKLTRVREILDDPIGTPCDICKGPCKVPKWVIYAGGQNYMNDESGQKYALRRAHRWFEAEWKKDIEHAKHPMRCTAVAPRGHDFAGQQCGNYAGHDGPHTVLIASEFLQSDRQIYSKFSTEKR